MSFIIPQQPRWIRITRRRDSSHENRPRASAIRSLGFGIDINILRLLRVLGISTSAKAFYGPQDGEDEEDETDYGAERDAEDYKVERLAGLVFGCIRFRSSS